MFIFGCHLSTFSSRQKIMHLGLRIFFPDNCTSLPLSILNNKYTQTELTFYLKLIAVLHFEMKT